MQPEISVIMATYNTPNDWLEESITSILNQTFTDFEFIIIDDCSTTDMGTIKGKYNDSRIIWLRNEFNIGLTKSLNIGLKIAKGKYIARMDADDVSLLERFQIQRDYMESHPEIIVCGSWRRAFGNENKNEIWNIPRTRGEQQTQLFFYNCGVTHPTAMFRKSMLDEYGIAYNENYKKAQDYGIWVQCTRYAPMAMIHKVLLQYRKSDSQVTANKASVKDYASLVKIDQLFSLGLHPSEEEKQMHISFCLGEYIENSDAISSWVNKLITANNEAMYFDKRAFIKIVSDRWYEYCKKQFVIAGKDNYKDLYFSNRHLRHILQDISVVLKTKIAKFIRN